MELSRSMPFQLANGEQFLSSQRVANSMSYTYECVFCSLDGHSLCSVYLVTPSKYTNTFGAYERNTGSCHQLDTRRRSSTGLSRHAVSEIDPLTGQGP
ncbi:hypothetical protein EV363DRAFT_1167863 [Boletus edulis]|nr:hypothetical protein EV363DRAFT_1167863 [Boletus edulis]